MKDEIITFMIAFLIVMVVLCADVLDKKLDTLILEQQRTNNWLEMQWHEMNWSQETFDKYCEENPEDCEILQ